MDAEMSSAKLIINEPVIKIEGTIMAAEEKTAKLIINGPEIKMEVKNRYKMKIDRLRCKYCHNSYSSRQEVKQHEDIHLVNKKMTCHICSKVFSRSNYLHEHMVIHQGKKPFPCDKCPTRFSLRCNLNRHKLIHSGEKPHKCEICGRKFTLKKNMIEHVRIHTGEKPFKCTHCEAKFARGSGLKRHTLIHTDVKNFKCHDCGKDFSWKYSLRRHIATHLKPIKEKASRKRRTKAELARDKEEMGTVAKNSSQKLIIHRQEIKIEEAENMTTRVFFPNSTFNLNFIKESTDAVEKEILEKALDAMRNEPVHPFGDIEASPSSRQVEPETTGIPLTCVEFEGHSTTFVPIKIKEEAIDDLVGWNLLS